MFLFETTSCMYHLHVTTVPPLCSNPPAPTEPGLSSATEEETSGYESEGVRSPSPTSPSLSGRTSPASPPSGRRPRTAFTAEQISTMEKAFKRNAYLGTQDKAELCKKLSLSDKQVRAPSLAFTTFCSIELCSSFPRSLADQKLVPEQANEAKEDGAGRSGSRLPSECRLSVDALS